MNQRPAGPEESEPSSGRRLNYLKLGFLLIVGLYGGVCALSPSTPRFLDRVLALHRDVHAAYYGELVWILMVLELWLEARRPDTKFG